LANAESVVLETAIDDEIHGGLGPRRRHDGEAQHRRRESDLLHHISH
jgi:hypothetical protein